MMEMTRYQIDTWKKVPLAMNTQPDISKTGNRECLDLAVRAGCWLRSDSTVYIEESIQVECLSNRPPWLAVVMEEGRGRHYNVEQLEVDTAGINERENSMLHVLDLGGNYWAIWTEADNLKNYYQKYPDGINTLHQRLGYRVRPSWIWQRKRYGTSEIVLAIANDGVSGVPEYCGCTWKVWMARSASVAGLMAVIRMVVGCDRLRLSCPRNWKVKK